MNNEKDCPLMKRIGYFFFSIFAVSLLAGTILFEFCYSLYFDSYKFRGCWIYIFPMIGFALVNLGLWFFAIKKTGLSRQQINFLLVIYTIIRLTFICAMVSVFGFVPPPKHSILYSTMTIVCLSGPIIAKIITKHRSKKL